MKLNNFKYQISNCKFLLLLLIIATAAVSCRPKGILHSWEMRDVLVDLHKTDAMLQLNGMRNSDTETKNIYYAQVLEKHGITQAEFDSSLVWYTAHPRLFDKIYPKVMAKLDAEEAEFLAAHEAELNLRTEQPMDEWEVTEIRTFEKADLDSILWVNLHSYPSSWHELPREYYGPFTSRP